MIIFDENWRPCCRLGNHLFQYAFLRNLSIKLNVPFYFPKWEGDKYFDLRDEKKRSKFKTMPQFIYDEPLDNPCFNPEALQLKDNTLIRGFFQSEKYFPKASCLQKWYTFKNKYISEIHSRYSHINFPTTTCLSLRINDDYNRARHVFPLYSLKYYQKALSKIKDTDTILIFSDRIDRAKIFFKALNGLNIHYVEHTKPYEQLYLQSLCKNNILTNSSFSWWGAWLNPLLYKNKNIFAPNPWFYSNSRSTQCNIYCKGWTPIEASDCLVNFLTFYRVNNMPYFSKNIKQTILYFILTRPLLQRAQLKNKWRRRDSFLKKILPGLIKELFHIS